MARPSRLAELEEENAQLRKQNARLRDLNEALNKENVAINGTLARLRCCRDPHCRLCNPCRIELFVRAYPTPLTLPQKYVEFPVFAENE